MDDLIKNELAEILRLQRLHELSRTRSRSELETLYRRVWDGQQLRTEFTVVGFLAPYAVVRRKADGILGSVEFQAHPRYYFNWRADAAYKNIEKRSCPGRQPGGSIG